VVSKTAVQPVSNVRWVPRARLRSNHYNPNHVAPPELELLTTSIREDRWTQPIVVLPDMTIVDGFHRWLVSNDPEIRAMTDGMVPIVVVGLDPVHRMMSTIRHNRARGTHAVLAMAEIVRAMVEAGTPGDEICRKLGMEDEELERLLDRSGMTVRGSAGVDGFGKAWVPSRSK
jgi:ParB-like chromosome segregation protein Spo0J